MGKYREGGEMGRKEKGRRCMNTTPALTNKSTAETLSLSCYNKNKNKCEKNNLNSEDNNEISMATTTHALTLLKHFLLTKLLLNCIDDNKQTRFSLNSYMEIPRK